jgi:crotonobetainyl-CoA:carnitine CoA-transferase CaiB-like acyl-CoA transferase
LAQEGAQTWEGRFAAAGIPAAAISTLPNVLADPQIAHRESIQSVPAPAIGAEAAYVNTPFKISGETTGAHHPPPVVGADTAAVLEEFGFTESEIAALRDSSAI